MNYDARQEWLDLATAQLVEIPMSLVFPLLAIAPKKEPWPNRLVHWIDGQVADKHAALMAEGAAIERLAALA